MNVDLSYILLFVFRYCVIYQGILETAEKMTNPLGEDDIDFPQLFIQWSLQKECKALYGLGVQMPWWNILALFSFNVKLYFEGKKCEETSGRWGDRWINGKNGFIVHVSFNHQY